MKLNANFYESKRSMLKMLSTQVLILRFYECYEIWEEGEDFAGVIMLRILTFGDYPGLTGWAPDAITSVLTRQSHRGI